ncbi:MAG: D-alanine--D-alanine ligase [Oscillospiraceae bacterium]|nr:D-alanine--D-alanine ligase [Oscillospiraceae bacterium]
MKTVLVVFGGKSTEYEVSLRSAASVIRNIPKDKYKVITAGITKDGRLFYYEGSVESIENNKWQEHGRPALFPNDFGASKLLVLNGGAYDLVHFDVAFPVLHGKNGEDGTIQGLFMFSGAAFAGCDTVSSAICMDKAFTNSLADHYGIKQAKWLSINAYDYEKDSAGFLNKAAEYLGFPIFAKPANAGSSVGISKVKKADELENAIKTAFQHDSKIVLEEGIDGMEIECAVLGNRAPIASRVGEIVPCNEFYDYDAKYIDDSELYVPARITDEKEEEVRAASVKIFKILCCSGLARVDFFVSGKDGMLYFNEINTMPGFTSISMYPRLFEKYGISYPELLDRLIQLAFEK